MCLYIFQVGDEVVSKNRNDHFVYIIKRVYTDKEGEDVVDVEPKTGGASYMGFPMSQFKKEKFTWIVEFEVDKIWVADGFDPSSNDFKDMLWNNLSYAYSHEIYARIVKAPERSQIQRAQNGD